MRYFLKLSYDGTDFHGWQRQPKARSVQSALELSLLKVLKKEIGVIGCGRTDAGVHASVYYLHIDLEEEVPPLFLFKLNHSLPDSIVVHECILAEGNWHARFSAYERAYDYFLHTDKTPFHRRFSTYFPCDPDQLNWSDMEKAADLLTQFKSFGGLCKSPDRHDSLICQINYAGFTREAGASHFKFQIRSNRFLRGMVRLIVAQLLDIGEGKTTLNAFHERLKSEERAAYFRCAPPQGLFLSAVSYPFFK